MKSARTAANALTINRRPPIRKRWGQHFLSDPNTIGRIVAEVHPVPSDYFLEIGPGHGELTIPLAESGAEVIAVDIDPLLINELRGQVPSNVTLEQGDILKADLSLLLRDGARIYGSLPYNISSQIIFKPAAVDGWAFYRAERGRPAHGRGSRQQNIWQDVGDATGFCRGADSIQSSADGF
ncbi:MAG: methyltransferase domain-containing protein [Candidatus Marinimicrobia bacterium]|nr:methyltransferase domain-containing protein [Candidatus Neomarinimicrobiota bacterium]